MQFLDAQKALCRKLDIDFTNISLNGLFSLEDIKGYINESSQEAWDIASWDFAEHSETGTLAALDVSNGYVPYPPNFASSSVFLMKLDNKEQDKKNFQDFLREFERSSASTKKYYAEYKRLVFFNKNLATVGSVVDVWGKKLFVALSADSDLLPFSPTTDSDNLSGNNAIITLAYAKALSSEKKRNPNQGALEEKRAYGVFGNLKSSEDKGKSAEQSTRPMFDAPDFFGKGFRGSPNVGTFTWSNNG